MSPEIREGAMAKRRTNSWLAESQKRDREFKRRVAKRTAELVGAVGKAIRGLRYQGVSFSFATSFGDEVVVKRSKR